MGPVLEPCRGHLGDRVVLLFTLGFQRGHDRVIADAECLAGSREEWFDTAPVQDELDVIRIALKQLDDRGLGTAFGEPFVSRRNPS